MVITILEVIKVENESNVPFRVFQTRGKVFIKGEWRVMQLSKRTCDHILDDVHREIIKRIKEDGQIDEGDGQFLNDIKETFKVR